MGVIEIVSYDYLEVTYFFHLKFGSFAQVVQNGEHTQAAVSSMPIKSRLRRVLVLFCFYMSPLGVLRAVFPVVCGHDARHVWLGLSKTKQKKTERTKGRLRSCTKVVAGLLHDKN